MPHVLSRQRRFVHLKTNGYFAKNSNLVSGFTFIHWPDSCRFRATPASTSLHSAAAFDSRRSSTPVDGQTPIHARTHARTRCSAAYGCRWSTYSPLFVAIVAFGNVKQFIATTRVPIHPRDADRRSLRSTLPRMRRTTAVRCNNPSPSDGDDDADPRLPTRPAAPMAISWPQHQQQHQHRAADEAGIFL